MARQNLANRPHIIVQAYKLIDIAREEWMPYRTAQRRKDKFATVLIETRPNEKNQKDKTKPRKPTIQKRYLDSRTTDLLRASWLFTN